MSGPLFAGIGSRRCFLATGGAALTLAAIAPLGGCMGPLFERGKAADSKEAAAFDDREIWLVGERTRPFGMTYLKVESVGLVTELANTGSDPPPSPELQMLKSEMLVNKVYRPNEVLASPTTSLVLVRGFLPPGVRKDALVDVEVRTAPKSETTSLRGGWLMSSRLKEMQVLGNDLKSGHLMALAEGRVLVDGVFSAAPVGDSESDGEKNERRVLEVRGRVLGGGRAMTSRALGLTVQNSEHFSVRTSSAIGAAINQRFFQIEDGGIKKGVAEPKRDDFIELTPLKLYERNLSRYMRVIANIPVGESPSERMKRLETLERQLLDRVSAPVAALQLEAIGVEAVDTLKKGLESDSREVRFYAAEALAYLDVAEAAPHLAEAAEHEPALRWHALAALAIMDDLEAYDALNRLLHLDSAECRYGAFWSLRIRNDRDPLVKGEVFGEEFAYHVIPTTGDPMIHVTRTRRPELVLFGHEQRMAPPSVLSAGRSIMIKETGPETVKVTRFIPGQENREANCSTKVDDIVRGIVEVGGGYAEVIEALTEAYDRKYLTTRIVIDASPRPGRYYRAGDGNDDETLEHGDLPVEEATPEITDAGSPTFDEEQGEVIDSSGSDSSADSKTLSRAHNPLPEIFQRRSGEDDESRVGWENEGDFAIDAAPPKKGFFDKMKWWNKD